MASNPTEKTDSDPTSLQQQLQQLQRKDLLKALAAASNNATGGLVSTSLQNGFTDSVSLALSTGHIPSIAPQAVQQMTAAHALAFLVAQQQQQQQQQQAASNAAMVNMLLAQQIQTSQIQASQMQASQNENTILQAIATARARASLGLTASHPAPAPTPSQSLLPALSRLAGQTPNLATSTNLVDATCASIAAAQQQQLQQQSIVSNQQQQSKEEPASDFQLLLQNAQAKLSGATLAAAENLNSLPSPPMAHSDSTDVKVPQMQASNNGKTNESSKPAGKKSPPPSTRRAPSDEAWNIMFERLKAFKELNGTCLVPQRYKDDPKLGNWVHHQRVASRRLTQERIRKLDSIGFSWKANNSWDIMFEKLVEFKRDHGDCVVPCNYELDPKLGRWVDNQRQRGSSSYEEGGMEKERWDKLQDIGFVWSVDRTKVWDTMFRRLKRFYEREGHCNVPFPYDRDPQLGRWAHKQKGRRKNLSPRIVKELDEMGFK